MIVKKLGMVAGGGFPGAGYNERKVAEGVARLMAMENVDAAMRHKVELLHEAGFDCAGEIEKYLKERSRTYGNTKTTRFQFHITASVKGQVMSADELTDFARQLMAEAGYGRQPYFVYYHHDTDNNHVHILSTRIQPNGFPIPDHHDYARLNAAANRILSSDINCDIQRMFSYGYLTEGQFANIIRSHGYKFERVDDSYVLFRGGVKATTISLSEIGRHISQGNDTRKERAKQLRAIIRKYKAEIAEGKVQNVENVKGHKGQKKKYVRRKVNPDIRKIKGSNGKTLSQEEQRHLSDLLDILKTKFGIDIHFQKDRNGDVRGYGIVDHNRKMALDGSKVMKLSELIDFAQKQERKASPLDIYRDLFSVEVRKSGMDGIMSIRLFDGSEHTRTMSPRQSAWYFSSPECEREDVAIRIAATMFSTEIFESVLLKHPVSNIGARIGSVNMIKMREGGRAIRVVSADGFSVTYSMSADELRCHARLQGEDANGYLRQLAILRITHQDATELTNRIKELTAKSTGSITLPLRPSDYTPEQAKAFTYHQCAVLTRLMPHDTSSTHSTNREWEVGKQSHYDHIDNQQSGTQLTM
ncbi:relaxase/mobilization nuclease domain-containing protein [Paramuribaculum intestinale]|uniref:relaxase/mobilization nuclease domain-containing protein n=1 Tax=Paramuribaculum intestinale TaxID=2094151 RepID=UPI00272C5A3F|nr:relaxase/mobilization nuclease domain-containing protein [Paramuribaculum intestinale]